jgi:hypothetical protein
MEPKEKRKSSVRYAPEVRERAVRMVREHTGEHASQWEAIGLSIGEEPGPRSASNRAPCSPLGQAAVVQHLNYGF